MDYYEKVREVSRELMEEKEYNNAQELYKRILPQFKNMPKKMRDGLNQEEQQQRIEALHILLLNIGLCHIKRQQYREAVKACKESIDHRNTNPKAYFRLALAQRENGELEPAKESILTALKLAPSDPAIRAEYKVLMEQMDRKHKEWFQKMNGFYKSDKLREIEQQDQEEQLLKEKLLKKDFNWDSNEGSSNF